MLQERLPEPIWLDTPAGISTLIEEIKRHDYIAVDTESNSLHAYREQVCLIQFSTRGEDFLVDPLAIRNLRALAPIFASPKIEKIFHAAEYDLICLQRDFNFTFKNIFDTMQAARTLGYPSIGLNAMLKEKYDITLNKRFQKADWGKRPLPAEMLDYARLDTRFLIPLRNELKQELQNRGRWELAKEDFQRACLVNGGRSNKNNCQWERISGHQDLSPREATILNELCEYREKMAERMNRPTFKVMRDQVLIAISQKAPTNEKGLAEAGLSSYQIRRFGASILQLVRRGQESPLVKRTPYERPDDRILARMDRLKQWRKRLARDMGVESDIVLPRIYVHTLAEAAPRNMEELESLMPDSPWRLRHFGGGILKAIGVK